MAEQAPLALQSPIGALVTRNVIALKKGYVIVAGLLLALLLTVFEGAFRKWVLAGELGTASYIAYLSKDFVFASLLLCPKRSPTQKSPQPFGIFLVAGGLLISAGAILSSVQGISPVGAFLDARSLLLLPAIAYLIVRRLP